MEDAERDLRAALDSGDPAAIEATTAAVDRLDTPRVAPGLLSSALWYAEQGIPTFALVPGRKFPHAACDECKVEPKCKGPHLCGHDQCHGFLDATTDPDRLHRWWEASPSDNVGLATGHLFDVVDIDGPVGQKARAERWDDIFGQVDADSIAKVLTPRPGGMHIWVPPTGDGSSGDVIVGIDYRGTGGYVLAPPSVITPGTGDAPGTYRFLGTPALNSGKVA